MTAPPDGVEPRPVAAIFDLDRTITGRATYTPFLGSVARRRPGAFRHLFAIAAAALCYKLGLTSRKRLKEVMLGAVLAGASRPEVAEFAAGFVERWTRSSLRPAATSAIAAHRQAGDYLVLATASFDFYAELFAARLGFDATVATRSDWDDAGRLTGRIDGENCYGAAKLEAVQAALPRLRQDYRVLVYSDHHSDVPLLRWADQAIAVAPSGRLRAIAAAEGFEVREWRGAA